MLKIQLLGPMRDFHDVVKANLEDSNISIRRVAPGPDLPIFKIQRGWLKEEEEKMRRARGKSVGAKASAAEEDPDDAAGARGGLGIVISVSEVDKRR